MEVKINIERDDEFNSIIKDGLKALNDSDKRELIKEVFKKSIIESEDLKKLFINQDRFGVYASSPTELTRDIIKNIDFNKEFEEFKEKLFNELINNTGSILKSLFIECVADKLKESYSLGTLIERALINSNN